MHARIPTRPNLSSRCLRCMIQGQRQQSLASVATATSPSPSQFPPIMRFPPTQPPSYKPPEQRKSQLLRSYASLLRSTPLMVLFQHNNLQSTEWMGIRRELTKALRKVDDTLNTTNNPDQPRPPPSNLAEQIRIQTVQTGIFAVALRIVEFYRPSQQQPVNDPRDFTHVLSESAHSNTVSKTHKRRKHPLDPLLAGPLALLTFPEVSPAHLKTALSILSPSPPLFAAPTRRLNPPYHELNVQKGLQKLMILGARIEGRILDADAARGVGLIEGGMNGLRQQLVGILQGVGMGLTGVLENPGRQVYVTMEGRRISLEDEMKEKKEE
ncbi:MAG: anthranilate phosphoribosyltransferase [Watsoniomyces obsoletus]|nr:MAG: anthranilate phosphoribosyltransferase [Watsoniomyces obsoletus]